MARELKILQEALHNIYEGRSNEMSIEETSDIFLKNCKTYDFNSSTMLYRGINNPNKYMLVEPKTHSRKSANTTNEYTIIIDNHPKFKSYPKRSQSIICTTNIEKSKMYGETFVVIPFDKSNCGVAEGGDIWYSFSELSRTFGVQTLNDFNLAIKFMLPYILNTTDIKTETWNDLRSNIKKVDLILNGMDINTKLELMSDLKYKLSLKVDRMFGKDAYFYRGTQLLGDALNDAFDPNNNEIHNTTFNNLRPNKDHEVWTDSNSLLISIDEFDTFKEFVSNK